MYNKMALLFGDPNSAEISDRCIHPACGRIWRGVLRCSLLRSLMSPCEVSCKEDYRILRKKEVYKYTKSQGILLFHECFMQLFLSQLSELSEFNYGGNQRERFCINLIQILPKHCFI